jgi:hypothetical protein
MKVIIELPNREVFEAAEQPEGFGCEIAEVIANQTFGFSSVSVIPQQRVHGGARVSSVLNSLFVDLLRSSTRGWNAASV